MKKNEIFAKAHKLTKSKLSSNIVYKDVFSQVLTEIYLGKKRNSINPANTIKVKPS